MRPALACTYLATLAFVVAPGHGVAQTPDPGVPSTSATAPSTAPASPRLAIAVLPVVASGVDPVVPRRVAETALATMGSLGYDVVPDVALLRAIDAVHPASPPTPAESWRITVLSGAQRGVSIRISARNSLYVAEILVASADGAGPFRVETTGDGATFLTNVEQALRATIPSPDSYDPDAAQRFAVGLATTGPSTPPPSWSTATYRRPPTYPARRPQHRYGLTFVTESALGRHDGTRYYNHVLGARMDFVVGQNVVIGLFSGYVNLDLGNHRGGNLLFYAQLEDRLQFMATGPVRFPLKVAFGFMPYNGPFLRFSGGVRFPVGDRFDIGLDLLAPTFWWIPGGRLVSYDLAAELTYRFGPTR